MNIEALEHSANNSDFSAAGSNTPVIGFTLCYAISNVLLALWGPVIIALTTP
ncbi:hypothetical protein [Pseudomonas sp. LB-090624]|uniref:hypothetical protein n=1 Tax=Pseudomonas sp. LB-090624 TaxID=2213079 RepID=UPI001304B93B|nr:hypothetical protein [Pseudomonas sp. LB-090624]